VTVATKTSYPSDGKIHITVSPEAKKTFTVKLRIPAWCKNPSIKVNGKETSSEAGSDGYVSARGEWKKGDTIDLRFDLEPRLAVGDRQNEGRTVVIYGPLVLAADEALFENTNAKLSKIGLPSTNLAALRVKVEPAPSKLKSWPGAKVFRINAVSRSNGSTKSEVPMQIRLIPFADAGATGTGYKIWMPYKEPRPDRNLLMDGIEIRSRKPNAGSIIDGNYESIAATFSNKKSAEDWFGVELDDPVSVRRIVFAHGKTFHDGGWFDASESKPRVQIQSSLKGEWKTIGELKDYPATTGSNAAKLNGGEQFVCELEKPMEVFGVRVIGKPAFGDNPKQAFSSCAELQAFAKLP
jgi:hypothetical protein